MRPPPVILVGLTLIKLVVLVALYSLRLSPSDPGPLEAEHDEGPASTER
jgi:hypothetical protein